MTNSSNNNTIEDLDNGRKPVEEFTEIDQIVLIDNLSKGKAIPAADDPELILPPELLHPPGLVGDIAEYIYAGMPRKQPIFAVASALATVSTATTNNFKVDGQHTPLGIYQALVGMTFCGKDHPMSEPSVILGKLGLGRHVYSSIASGPALLQTLSRMDQDEEYAGPTMLVCMDEFGKALKKATTMGDGHSFGSITELMSLYGKGCKTLGARAYAKEKDCTPPIEFPFVNVLAATTPETLISALSSEAVVDGFLNRFMIVNATIETPSMEVTGNHPQIAEQTIFKLNGLKLSNVNNHSEKITINRGEGIIAMSEKFSDYADRKSQEGVTGKLWGRAYQNAIAIAGILAVGDAIEPQQPVLRPIHFQWATTWVKWCVESCIMMVKDHVADSKEEVERKKILMLIRDAQKYLESKMAQNYLDHLKEGYAPREWLMRKANFQKEIFDKHLSTLLGMGLIAVEDVPGGAGRRRLLRYYLKAS